MNTLIWVLIVAQTVICACIFHATQRYIAARLRANAAGAAVVLSYHQRLLRAREAKGFDVERAWLDLARKMSDPEWIETEADNIIKEEPK